MFEVHHSQTIRGIAAGAADTDQFDPRGAFFIIWRKQ
jgi:hypothetical protein